MFSKFEWPEIGFDELRKRARILVIDDSAFEYEKLFKDAMYAIDKWNDIENIAALENGSFDIILLDIQGVGKSFSSEQGFGVLKHIKKVNPSQIILAYSNSDYKLKYQDFFKLANDTLDKSQDFYEYKQKVDKYIKIRFSYDYYVELITNKIGTEYNNKNKIIKYINRSIMKTDQNYFRSKISSLKLSQDTISFILNVLSFAITTYTTLNGMTK